MFRIRRFSVISTANTVAIMYFIGFLIILVPLVLIFSIAQVTVTDASGQQSTFGVGGGLVFLLLVPILYGIVAWVGTALFCLLYNLTARFTGGMGVDVWRNLPDAAAAPPASVSPPASAPPLQG